MRRRQPCRRHDLLHPARGHPRGRLLHRRAQPRRRRVLRGRRQQLPGRTHEPQPVVGAPHQRLLPQRPERPRQRRGDRRITLVTRHQPEQHLVRRRLRRHRQRLRRLQREPVQPLQCPHDRRTGARAGRELREVGGNGRDEVGAGAQQRTQGGVVPGTERLREGPRRCGLVAHPAHVSGSPPAAGPVGRRRGALPAPGSVSYTQAPGGVVCDRCDGGGRIRHPEPGGRRRPSALAVLGFALGPGRPGPRLAVRLR